MTMMPEIILVAHNIRSTHNVGSIFRTAEGFGVSKIIISGYTPYPSLPNDRRLPHIADKLNNQISKTALGAESSVPFTLTDNILATAKELKAEGYSIVGLEQDARSVPINEYETPEKLVLVLGEEVHGIESELLGVCDDIIEIAMKGQKESFNVSVATGIALYALSSNL